MTSSPLYLGIDIGTGSARAALFDSTGKKVASSSHAIKTRNERENHYEQSSSDIWGAVKVCVRDACASFRERSKRDPLVASIGVDATCSLVACRDDGTFEPVSVVADDDLAVDGDIYNIMLWLDRRSIKEANYINAMEDEEIERVRLHFGDVISPENEPPKLLWLHRHKPQVIREALFFDLADWLAFKLCGKKSNRSSCTVACKWGWGSNDGDNGEWSSAFWERLGLEQLCENGFTKIGGTIIKPARPVGKLTSGAADELGLSTECVIASPMIDAHAGSLWTLGVSSPLVQELAPSIEQRISVIAGTSTCFIELSRNPLFVDGVWGPFRDAVLPGFHVTEGGQSVTGKLLDHTIESHPSFAGLRDRVGTQKVYDVLAEMTETVVQAGQRDPAEHVHCLDYHAGNRSPRADPSLKGCFIGLTLSTDEYDMAVKFRATVQALCYGARHIIEKMRSAGHDIRLVTACGGLCKSKLFLQELADCLNIPVVLSSEEDTVLLGGAILAKTAHSLSMGERDHARCVLETAAEMTRIGDVITPNNARKSYHDRKYAVYHKLHEDYLSYREMMGEP